ncbi:hypothetical protein ACROYT_G007620 [Oculina patagonica]
MASMIVTVAFKATFGLLRRLAAERLKEGDVVDAKLRDVIVDKIDNINTKLDALAGKDLAASMSFFMDGLVYLEKVLNQRTTHREKPEKDTGATQAVGAVVGIMDEEHLAEKLKNLQPTNLNEAARKNLEYAKKRFDEARKKAVEAFGNKALSTADRLLAMAIRIMATLLEQVEDLTNALASCKLCLQELHSLSAVQENFSLELKKGFKSKFGKDERNEIIVAVCQMNRVIYDVIQMVDEGASKSKELLIWPCVDVGDERIDCLHDSRIARKLRKLGIAQFCVQAWSFGHEGNEEQKLKSVKGIAINTKGQFIIAEGDVVKRFDSSGKFLDSFSPVIDTWIEDVATDRDDNMYVLIAKDLFDASKRGAVQVFDTQAKLHHSFLIRPEYRVFSLVVDDSGNVLVSVSEIPKPEVSGKPYYGERDDSSDDLREMMVEVYENHGRLLHRIEVMCQARPSKCHISTTGDGRVMVLDPASRTLHLFSASEDYPFDKKIQLRQASPEDRPNAMTFHQASEQLIIASFNDKTNIFRVSLYNRDGDYVRSIPLEDVYCIKRIVITNNGRIALVDVRLSVPKTRIIIV